jgi:hypothetical protein
MVQNDTKLMASNRADTDLRGSQLGWTGANLVIWNSQALGYNFQSPPTAQNWLIGSSGTVDPPIAAYGESPPHFDFRNPAEHGAMADLGLSPSLFRTANMKWRARPFNTEERHYFVGDPDQPATGDFGTAGDGPDDVYVDPAFDTWTSTQYQRSRGKFDEAVTDRNVSFTFRFQLEPGEEVVHAYLTARVERASWIDSGQHHITLAGRNFNQPSGRARYYMKCETGETPADCVAIPGNLTGPEGWPTNVTEGMVRVIDLHPHLQFLNDVDSSGFAELNVNLYRRTRVDWASLTLIVKHP